MKVAGPVQQQTDHVNGTISVGPQQLQHRVTRNHDDMRALECNQAGIARAACRERD
ncbi:hypothetical protein RI103_34490 [Paraburkholderia sp. FT54]|uniref:hypothetical protein n=1 Tax=Paraburkholderia sp. FT54 TaxID=3074437 RepID=UPI002877C5FF|nr:hypothetical protein [Paraburkholderia sp. FT54]WNC94991.1 hypothetical protein RI103_34490 [Paraburkholderia sp. FT54]